MCATENRMTENVIGWRRFFKASVFTIHHARVCDVRVDLQKQYCHPQQRINFPAFRWQQHKNINENRI